MSTLIAFWIWLIYWLFGLDWMIDWLIDSVWFDLMSWLIDRLIGCWINWLIDCFDRSIGWFIDWLDWIWLEWIGLSWFGFDRKGLGRSIDRLICVIDCILNVNLMFLLFWFESFHANLIEYFVWIGLDWIWLDCFGFFLNLICFDRLDFGFD